MTNKEDRIKMLMQQRKRGGWAGFWSIREESAEWGYDLAVADMHGLLCQLSEEEKKLPVIQKLVGWPGSQNIVCPVVTEPSVSYRVTSFSLIGDGVAYCFKYTNLNL